MGSNKAPSWSDQWGTGGIDNDNYEYEGDKLKKSGSSNKLSGAKAAASAGMDKAKSVALVGADKAKSAAAVGAQKVKSGTFAGLKWVKNQYQKRSSK
ncbi:hypothetical protein TanjilG_03109 [Lupinus angustifolius]|uniref:CDP-diacylglycerol-glycerol-3-phosphate 3-phosphatidyltransferase n=1 Tax=Lupinus angustifolius TaxID=3871 RepID=A0A4P1RD41_LUPAN|nr:PREDICTED: uncharacterized protein LOC109351777 [Lupinus angustifolius]XP_019448943.1 PREDICTED: uncharacterized protein LOC109351777 [Lupinus angustifolius]XP_019448944.1 PREDICTED: uncharacterized protein LOC109351777 [Lupinus angustifolius]XP_019448945.1 PREDICTED: uncharacterized protein LOC109351777 [Lupinus angustifolius]XP_019448946.1 PREDICTED: uncharacterized protein LOC109351777 [Lupinus angustifolius]XP_019448947.1 PREDICTED: uncharacterized protein LOC109351777 [Lupinus angustif